MKKGPFFGKYFNYMLFWPIFEKKIFSHKSIRENVYLFSRKFSQTFKVVRQEQLCDSDCKNWLFCQIWITFAKKEEKSDDFRENLIFLTIFAEKKISRNSYFRESERSLFFSTLISFKFGCFSSIFPN